MPWMSWFCWFCSLQYLKSPEEAIFEIFPKISKFFTKMNFFKIFEKSKISKKIFFFKKSYFFFLNLYCTCSKLSYDVYNSHVSKIFKFWHIFAWNFSYFAMVFRQPDWPKLQPIEYCFWCLWTAKDQKSLMEVIFGL